jgi:glycosyltransferase involved in cell wall biosynthesis
MRGAAFVSAAARPMQMQAIERAGVEPERSYTMWMGVETDRVTPPPRGSGNGSHLRLITVARLNRAKGHEHALGAIRIVMDEGVPIKYVIAGSGPHEQAIRARIERLGLGDAVTLRGTMDEQSVIDLLHQSDAFVLASVGLGEASPVAVMEAMSVGLPVVCSRIGGTADMITDGTDGFLTEMGDEAGIAARLKELAGSEELRARLGDAARRRAIEQFDVTRTTARMLDAIERHTAWRRPR